jgi:hypothetical protein
MGGAQSVTFVPKTGSLSLKFPDPKLIPGGSMISGDSMMISGGTETGTKGGGATTGVYQETGTTASSKTIYQLGCVVLVCLCLILIMIGIFFAMKKSVTTANK